MCATSSSVSLFVFERAVPLEHRELGLVQLALLAAAKGFADLVHAGQRGRERALHLILGAGVQPARRAAHAEHLDGVEVHIEAGAGHDRRRLELEHALRVEERTRRLQRLVPAAQVREPLADQVTEIAVGPGEALAAPVLELDARGLHLPFAPDTLYLHDRAEQLHLGARHLRAAGVVLQREAASGDGDHAAGEPHGRIGAERGQTRSRTARQHGSTS
jgi:hypothetical protein